MLLNNLLKPSIIELSKLSQVVDIRNDIAQVLFKHFKVLLSRSCLCSLAAALPVPRRRRRPRVELLNHILHLFLRHLDPPHYLARLDLLERKHLVQLGLEDPHKVALVRLFPYGRGAQARLELGLELVVGDVVVVVVLDEGGAELLAEPGVCQRGKQRGGKSVKLLHGCGESVVPGLLLLLCCSEDIPNGADKGGGGGGRRRRRRS